MATARSTTTPIGGGGGLWHRPATAARPSLLQGAAGRAMSGMQRAARSPSSGHLAMPAGLGGSPPLPPRAAAAAAFWTTGPLKGAAFPAGFKAAPLLAAAASRSPCSGHLAMPAGLGGAPPLLAAAASRTAPLKGVVLLAGFGRARAASRFLAAASRSRNSGHLAMPVKFGGAPPPLPPAIAASKTVPLKGAALAAWLGRAAPAPLLAATCYASKGETPSGDGDLEPSNTGDKSDMLLEEMKGINTKLYHLSRLLEETMTFRFLLKRLFWRIIITLLLTTLGFLLIYKVVKAIGLTDIHGFLKNVFITFITDEEIRAKSQEAINSYADATLNHLIPWIKLVKRCKSYMQRVLSRKK